jgi:hypothetical protein
MRRLLLVAMPALMGLAGLVFSLGAASATSPATFARRPAAGPPGTSLTVSSITPCPPNPAGVAGPRVVRVSLVEAGRGVGFAQLPVAASGAWSGTLVVSRSARPGAATLGAFCASSPQAEGATLAYELRSFAVTAAAAPGVPGAPRLTG